MGGWASITASKKEKNLGGGGGFILDLKSGYQVLLTPSSYPFSCAL